MGKRTQIGYQDHELFIAAMEQASEAGDADFISQNMDPVEKLIARLQDRGYEIAELQGRSRPRLRRLGIDGPQSRSASERFQL